MLRRLNIACGIAHKPKLIILDEPTVAVDPQSRNNILEGIQKLNKAGATIVYTSHYMEEVEQICTRISIMDKGRIIATGTKEELKSMISTGEKITVELFKVSDEVTTYISSMPNVISASLENNMLIVKSKQNGNSLTLIVEYLKDKNIPYGKIYSELPTLNDVFLEITGKHLRD
ncbi:Daunorubicin/doxorubicin resistance ATP-binding protein DrrA [compost metagenome]